MQQQREEETIVLVVIIVVLVVQVVSQVQQKVVVVVVVVVVAAVAAAVSLSEFRTPGAPELLDLDSAGKADVCSSMTQHVAPGRSWQSSMSYPSGGLAGLGISKVWRRQHKRK